MLIYMWLYLYADIFCKKLVYFYLEKVAHNNYYTTAKYINQLGKKIRFFLHVLVSNFD
jgi:hypothetical protein